MNAVFADAGYWIALLNPRDQLHTKAITVSNTLQGRSIVTSQMVLTEFLNHYAGRWANPSANVPYRSCAACRTIQMSTLCRKRRRSLPRL